MDDEDAYAPLGVGYPGDNERAYEFNPRPIEPSPPVSPHEFQHHFYAQSWHRVVTRALRRRKGKRSSKPASTDIVSHLLPKRHSQLDKDANVREVFWGLYAVERRSALMATAYSLLFSLPSIYFFFAWLFQWGHSGDLQSAAVPLSISLACLTFFWGIVLMTSPRFEGKQKVD